MHTATLFPRSLCSSSSAVAPGTAQTIASPLIAELAFLGMRHGAEPIQSSAETCTRQPAPSGPVSVQAAHGYRLFKVGRCIGCTCVKQAALLRGALSTGVDRRPAVFPVKAGSRFAAAAAAANSTVKAVPSGVYTSILPYMGVAGRNRIAWAKGAATAVLRRFWNRCGH